MHSLQLRSAICASRNILAAPLGHADALGVIRGFGESVLAIFLQSVLVYVAILVNLPSVSKGDAVLFDTTGGFGPAFRYGVSGPGCPGPPEDLSCGARPVKPFQVIPGQSTPDDWATFYNVRPIPGGAPPAPPPPTGWVTPYPSGDQAINAPPGEYRYFFQVDVPTAAQVSNQNGAILYR